jgi:hypothetical protein
MATVTPADALAAKLQDAGLGAGADENNLAVRVVNPDTAGSTLVWLPCDEDPDYIWGHTFSFTAPGTLSPSRVAEMIKASAVNW